ncbi:MAG TPA: hypothetical protein V6C82_07465, partial [Chroococcales cyanobacterium]
MQKKFQPLLLTALALVGCAAPAVQPILSRDSLTPSKVFTDGNGRERTLDFDYKEAEKNGWTLRSTKNTREGLPPSVDLRSTCSPVGNQGKLGACTAWAIGRGLREFKEIKEGQPLVQLSPLYLYYKERELEDSTAVDHGATLTEGIIVLNKTGICPEEKWPYDITKFAVKPSVEAEAAAGA